MASSFVSSGVLLCFVTLSLFLVAEAQIKGKITSGQAGYYGAPNGEGTNGGACGYGFRTFSIYTASATTPIYKNGVNCGACYSIKCVGKKCKSNKAVVVKVNNFCDSTKDPQCDGGANHFDLTMPVYQAIAKRLIDTPVPITFQRVSCVAKGPVVFVLSKYIGYFSIVVDNVNKYGNILKLEFKAAGSSKWVTMNRVFGANWGYSGNPKFPLALRLTSSIDQRVLTTGKGCIPDTDGVATYTCKVNY